MSAKRAPQPCAVVPVDKEGRFLLTPEGFTVRSSLGNSLEQYLRYRERGVRRADRVHFAYLQDRVDGLLRAVVDGKNPTVVFKLEPRKRRGQRKDVRREQAMCQEVLRLSMLHEMQLAAAKEAVAEAFDVDVQMVARAVKNWRDNLPDLGNLKAYIENYERNLRIRKFLT